MAKPRNIEMAVINITTHPHSPEQYVELFQDASNLKTPVDYLGVEKLIISNTRPIDGVDPLNGITGFFHKFVDIDIHAPWMNLAKLETVVSQDGEPVIDIPEDMKPHCKSAPFVFLPKGHRFFFVAKDRKVTFSSAYVARSLMKLFAHSDLFEKYGEVQVIVESEEDSIEKILAISTLTKLTVWVSLPNDDDLSKYSDQALARMKKQHAKKVQTVWTGDKKEGVKPDDDTKGFMGLALSNGSIKAEGYEEGEKVVDSTSSHPVTYKVSCPSDQSTMSRLIVLARQQISRFTGRNVQ